MKELEAFKDKVYEVMFHQRVIRQADERDKAHKTLDAMIDTLAAQGGSVHLLYLGKQIAEEMGVVVVPKESVRAIAENESERGDSPTGTLELLKGVDYVEATGDVHVGRF